MAGPLPCTRSFLISVVGGSPDGASISGFFFRSVAFLMTGTCPVVAFGWAGSVVVDAGVVAAFVPVDLDSDFLSSPQPAAISATAASGTTRRAAIMGGHPRQPDASTHPINDPRVRLRSRHGRPRRVGGP